MRQHTVEQLVDERLVHWIDELKNFLSIRSVSTRDLLNKKEMGRALDFLIKQFRILGIKDIRTIQTEGYPLLYAEYGKNPSKPTLLIYGHYDVQPAGEKSDWMSDPFKPVIRDEKLYARGATDNKGQLWILIKSLETFKDVLEEIPFNIKFLIEGEEEIGSKHVCQFIQNNAELLECDFVLISDTAMLSENKPSICYGLRGSIDFTLKVTGPNKDLHSGSFFGGAVQNPNFSLISLIQSMKSKDGKITIEHFYDGVQDITERELANFKAMQFSIEALKESIGVDELIGEPGYTYFERIWSRPTLEVVSISGGEAGKSAIPHCAIANISCRLVPGQDPYRVEDIIKQHIKSYSPLGVKIETDFTTHVYPYYMSLDEPLLCFAEKAYKKAYKEEVSFIRAGGSIPLVELMSRHLKVPVMLMGFSHPDANVHGPNEYMNLHTFRKGIKTLVYFYNEVLVNYKRDNS